jgi:hypothetical protein
MTSPIMATDAAFPDPKRRPKGNDLAEALGRAAFTDIAKLQAWLVTTYPAAINDWRFSAQSGWHQIPMLKKRRLFYLIPKRGGFRLNLILGDKAVRALETGAQAKRVATLLKTAKRYPEGTAFSFSQDSFDHDLVAAMIEAKLAK